MRQALIEKLGSYIVIHYPELLMRLQRENAVVRYLEEKVDHILPILDRLLEADLPGHTIGELCIKSFVIELGPSRFDYLKKVLEEDFPKEYRRLRFNGLLADETINLIGVCKKTFEAFDFSEGTEHDCHLRCAVISKVYDHFNQ